MNPIIQATLPTVAKAIVDRALAAGWSQKVKTAREQVRDALGLHLATVAKWSSSLHTLGYAAPFETDRDTVEIGFDSQPRRFSLAARHSQELAEGDLLRNETNYLVLGNPGSGKSTAIKRIARRLLTQDQLEDEAVEFPVVLRLRELQRGESLFVALAKTIGVEHQIVEVVGNIGGARSTRTEVRIGKSPIEIALPDILSGFSPLVLLDGLDEVWSDARAEIAAEIEVLAKALHAGKLVVTSRPGEFTSVLEGFASVELRPLEQSQIRRIAQLRLEQPDEFMSALEKLPYRDIADRPLLLTQLVLLFDRYGFLPTQPSQVYRRVVRVLLEDWDALRRIRRPSVYAGFDADSKADFLADMAYYLTYTSRRAQFTEDELVAAYLKVHARFGLPERDARRVVREIETHTGIVVAAGVDSFEFSHLSIQEFLCASFLVRSNAPLLVRRALEIHPAAVAVAAALSSQPSEWLSRLILAPEHQQWVVRSGVASFLRRLMIEKPALEPYEPLGAAAMHLTAKLVRREGAIPPELEMFMRERTVEGSIAQALRWYSLVRNSGGDSVAWLARRQGIGSSYDIEMPDDCAVPRSVLERLAAANGDLTIWQSVAGPPRANTIARWLRGQAPLQDTP